MTSPPAYEMASTQCRRTMTWFPTQQRRNILRSDQSGRNR
jgi:hypothetical protein